MLGHVSSGLMCKGFDQQLPLQEAYQLPPSVLWHSPSILNLHQWQRVQAGEKCLPWASALV